jgi:hypothetical protein
MCAKMVRDVHRIALFYVHPVINDKKIMIKWFKWLLYREQPSQPPQNQRKWRWVYSSLYSSSSSVVVVRDSSSDETNGPSCCDVLNSITILLFKNFFLYIVIIFQISYFLYFFKFVCIFFIPFPSFARAVVVVVD